MKEKSTLKDVANNYLTHTVLKHNIVILSNKIAKINIFGNFSKRREVYGYIFL